MGKIRIKTIGDEEQEEKQKKQARLVREAGQAQKRQEIKKDLVPGSDALKAETAAPLKKTKKAKFAKEKKSARSKQYQTIAKLVDRTKIHSISEAVALLPKLKRAKFDETIELHINTTEQGISGNVTLPHGTGKKMRVAIANDEVIASVEKGIIDFDILLAAPQMMPKLARVAKILGPRGLMPNPKNGTISQNPQDLAKKFEDGQINFKTEVKAPIIHMTVGKISFGDKKLGENIKVTIRAIQEKNIKNAVLKSTMSPGIKIAI